MEDNYFVFSYLIYVTVDEKQAIAHANTFYNQFTV